MRILIMTDSLFVPTGLGRVGKEIATGLAKKGHQIGYIGWYHRDGIPFNVPTGITYWHTNNNYYGQDVLDAVVLQFQPEVVLTVGDMWWLEYIANPNLCRTRNMFQWCCYIPVDGEPIGGGLPPRLINTVADVDLPVAYTDYAKEAVLKSVQDHETRLRVETIYHGVDTNIFKPLEHAERQKLRDQYGIGDRFLFLTVSRNQSRKNIPEVLRAWKRFSELPETRGKVLLWPHMNFNDPMGWQIDDLMKVIGIKNQSVMFYEQIAHGQSEMHLLPDADLAKLYQIADAFVLISGEGFGLPTIEAMATKLPCVLLDYAASAELGAEHRAELVPVGDTTWTGLHLTQRPLPTIDSIINSMRKVFLEPVYRREIAHRGYDFAVQFSWEKVINDWHNYFIRQEVPFIKEKELEVVS